MSLIRQSEIPTRGRVLVVEDEFYIADELAVAVSARGLDVVGPVATVREAYAIIMSERIDAAVLDVNLRGEPITPVADALASRRIPFFLATGYDIEALPERYRQFPLWEKPIRVHDLADAILEATTQGSRGRATPFGEPHPTK